MKMLQMAWRIFLKDLRIETRTQEITTTTGLFAVLVVVLASLSFYMDRNTAAEMAPGVLWVSTAFAGVLAMGRSWSREREHDVMRALLLAPIPRAAIYLGKMAAAFLFLSVVEAFILPIVGVLFHLDLIEEMIRVALLLVLGTVGFVAAGTLFAAMTVRTAARDLAISVALFPLVTPVLLAGVVATRDVLAGADWASTMQWIPILLALDVVFLAAGVYLFEPLNRE